MAQMGIYLGAPKPLIRSYLDTRSTFTLINFPYYLKTRWVPRVKSFCICPDLKVLSFQNMASDMIYIKVSSIFFLENWFQKTGNKNREEFSKHTILAVPETNYWNLVIRKRCEIPIDQQELKSSCIFQIGFQAFPVLCVFFRGLCHGEKETHKNVQTSSR